jgi:hypothetical protein
MRAALHAAAGAVLGFALALVVGVVVAIGVGWAGPVPSGAADMAGASVKAMRLGQAISEGMNTAAFAALLLVPSGAFVAWWRSRRTRDRSPGERA